jgi:hypothetical protein
MSEMVEDPMGLLNFNEEEFAVSEQLHADAPRGIPEKRICACGHSVARHKVNPFIRERKAYICSLPNGTCPCKEVRPTLKVKDTRMFVRKTLGPGVAHALIRGMQAVKEKSEDDYKAIEWLIAPTCEKCDREGIKVSPVNMSFQGAFTESGNDVTVFLCDECRFPGA